MKNEFDDLKPNKELFWFSVKWIAFIVGLVVAIRFMIMPIFMADKLVGREVQKFDAETSAQVYDNSRQFQQGVNRDIARYCRDWDGAEGAAKRAVADLIQTTADTYQGELTNSNQDCLSSIKGN